MATRAPDLTGQRFGRLVVVSRAPNYESSSRTARWNCICDCGKETITNATQLRTGGSVSCGCYSAEDAGKRAFKHGAHKDKLYKVYVAMRQRCENPNNPAYPNYGGRGISVCEEWRASYASFAMHMGDRPSSRHTIERIDVNGHYCPDNVVWATRGQQARNKRTNVMIEFDGRVRCLTDWANTIGISEGNLHWRIYTAKWPLRKALTTPPDQTTLVATWNGSTKTLKEWSDETGIPYGTLHRRIFKQEWPVDKAFSEPIKEQAPSLVSYKGRTQSLPDWAEELQIPVRLLRSRVYEQGWSIERAFTEPPNKGKTYTVGDRTLTLLQWSRASGMSKRTLRDRIEKGWSMEKALSEPTERGPIYEFEGKCLNLKDWSRETGIPHKTLWHRLVKKGMPIQDALFDRRRKPSEGVFQDRQNTLEKHPGVIYTFFWT